MGVVTTGTGVKVRAIELLEIQIGGTSVFLDRDAARIFFKDLATQLDTAEIVHLNIDCTRTSSKISNFPLSRREATQLYQDLDWFINN